VPRLGVGETLAVAGAAPQIHDLDQRLLLAVVVDAPRDSFAWIDADARRAGERGARTVVLLVEHEHAPPLLASLGAGRGARRGRGRWGRSRGRLALRQQRSRGHGQE